MHHLPLRHKFDRLPTSTLTHAEAALLYYSAVYQQVVLFYHHILRYKGKKRRAIARPTFIFRMF
jgi:hypothetical protein